jgi:pimeloyl-ACP methyl ester carboxylesterase
VTPSRWAKSDAYVQGLRLHVRRIVELNQVAPPILLLHGLGVSGAVWQTFGRRLAPRFAAVAPDLRGHGLSDAPPGGYEPDDYARDLIGLWDDVLPGPAPVMGHSLGSLVAVALARLAPELVSALVLVDPPLDPERSNPDVAEVRRLKHAPDDALERYLEATNPRGGPLLAQALATQFRQAADAAFDAMLAAAPGHPEIWQQAASLRQPCLVVQADPAQGGVLGDAAARRFADRLAHGQLVKLVGASHAVHASQPAPLAEAVLRFLVVEVEGGR